MGEAAANRRHDEGRRMTARRCLGITKAGTPCKAAPLKVTDHCLAHSDAETRGSVGFTPEAGKLGGRPAAPKAVDLIRERVETEIEEWYSVLIEARDAQRAVVVGSGEHAEVEYVPDHTVRLAAFREAMDRAYGRPKQAQEVSGPDGAPLVAGFDPKRLTADELRNVVSLVGRARGNDPA